jgi:MFS family permease
MRSPASTAPVDEWRDHWPLVAAGVVGYSVFAMQTYVIGPFVIPLQHEFGWTRGQVMMGLTLSNFTGIFVNIAVGVLVDRLGARQVGLAGIVVKVGAIALLGTATGTLFNWSLLWMLVALGAMLTQSTIWTKPVSEAFDRSRGLALAVTLTGSSLCAAVSPVLGAWMIARFGWRLAFPAVAACWLLVAFPVILWSYRRRRIIDGPRTVDPVAVDPAGAQPQPGLTLAQAARTGAFWRLVASTASFAIYTMAISPNLVPLMEEKGQAAMAAAQIASIVGLVAIVARISAGFLLDRLPPTIVGGCIFLLPAIGCAILLSPSPGLVLEILAVATFGMTIGAEYDVVVYLTSRHFGRRSLGALFGAMLTAGALGGAVAPITSGWIRDHFGNYDVMLGLLMVLMIASSALIATMGCPSAQWDQGHGAARAA